MQKLNDKTYHAAIYLRLSQEDGDISVSDKNESNSISTQRDLIHTFIQKQPDILYRAEFCDDGYTGANFDRPGFNAMMAEVEAGHVEAIIVKDMSRLGRDYLKVGQIMELLRQKNVRLIALNDGVDQHNIHGGNEDSDILVPEFSFDLATVPMIFIHGDADGWASMNSVKCWEKMRAMGIQSELHTLALRNHCFQHYSSPGTGSYTHLDRIWDFLSAKGFCK